MAETPHVFGGEWTDRKLTILRDYLNAYSTALSKQAFKRGYIDAFAGTGFRVTSSSAKLDEEGRMRQERELERPSLFDVPSDAEPEGGLEFLDGSARIALQCEPKFDRYIFIEKNARRCAELEHLKEDFPDLSNRIDIHRGDANVELQALCAEDWTRRRAVLFLDPYGTQVQWATIEAIAGTQAIDLWVLFPLGGVSRMLKTDGKIPLEWRSRLDEVLGTPDWHDEFYRTETVPSLFEDEAEQVIKARSTAVAEFFLKRLKTCFAGVADNPAFLYNSKNSPLFVLCFAAGNPKGAPIALRIASSILRSS